MGLSLAPWAVSETTAARTASPKRPRETQARMNASTTSILAPFSTPSASSANASCSSLESSIASATATRPSQALARRAGCSRRTENRRAAVGASPRASAAHARSSSLGAGGNPRVSSNERFQDGHSRLSRPALVCHLTGWRQPSWLTANNSFPSTAQRIWSRSIHSCPSSRKSTTVLPSCHVPRKPPCMLFVGFKAGQCKLGEPPEAKPQGEASLFQVDLVGGKARWTLPEVVRADEHVDEPGMAARELPAKGPQDVARGLSRPAFVGEHRGGPRFSASAFGDRREGVLRPGGTEPVGKRVPDAERGARGVVIGPAL